MDVSTSVCDDPKFRRLQRENPELVAVGVTAYLATMAESWKAGRRVSVEEAWPAILPFDKTAADALIRVGLLDRRGLLSTKAWRSWFDPARKRREQSRDRWARYNAKRDADTTPPPRGSDVSTATSDPSVPSVRSVPSGSARPSTARGEKNGLKPDDERRRALADLSERFQRKEIDLLTYERERRMLAS
jgi:hypothetical protein